MLLGALLAIRSGPPSRRGSKAVAVRGRVAVARCKSVRVRGADRISNARGAREARHVLICESRVIPFQTHGSWVGEAFG